MKIFFILDAFKNYEGEREFLFARRLKEMGNEVHWLSFIKEIEEEIEREGISVHRIEENESLDFFTEENLRNISFQLKKIFKEQPPHIVHIHSEKLLIPAGMECLERGIPYTICFYSPQSYSIFYGKEGEGKGFLSEIFEEILKRSDGIICASEVILEKLSSHFPGISQKLSFLPDPFDEDAFKQEFSFEKNWFLLLRTDIKPEREKEIMNAIDFFAFIKLKNPLFTLHVEGDVSSKYAEELKAQLRQKYGEIVNSIIFLGKRKDIPQLLKKHFSLMGSGRVIIEALASGKPSLIINDEGLKGVASPSMVETLMRRNYTGSGLVKVNYEKAFNDLVSWDVETAKKISDYIFSNHRSRELAAKFMDNFAQAIKKHSFKESMEGFTSFLYTLYGENEKLLLEIERKNGELKDIKESFGWIIVEKLYSLAYKLFPPPSKRYILIRNLLKTLLKKYREKEERKKKLYLSELDNILRKEKDIKGVFIFLQNIEWNTPIFQRPHHLSLQFSKLGYLVFFCTPSANYDRVRGFKRFAERLYLSSIPVEFFSIIECPVFFISWAVYENYLKHFKNYRLIYDVIDELEIFQLHDRKMLKQHHALLKMADVVSVTANRLYEKVKRSREDAILVENACDFHHFHKAFERKEDIAKEIVHLKKKFKGIIGYYGALAEWTDYNLIIKTASHYPQFAYVLVGLDYDGSIRKSGINKFSNIFYLGPKPYEILPSYLAGFDVATIPFLINNITLSTSPIKLFEYLSAGKPCVTTALPECEKYSPPVLVAKDREDFILKIDEAMKMKDEPSYIKMAISIARENTWEKRAEKILSHLESKMGLNNK